MRLRLLPALALLAAATPAFAHRLEGYLQASVLSLGAEYLTISLSLTPGHDVAKALKTEIDTDADGSLALSELQHYAETVGSDLHVTLDGKTVPLALEEIVVPEESQFLDGHAPLQLKFVAAMPQGSGAHRLLYENAHHPDSAVRLVNLEVPSDPIAAGTQERTEDQARYELSFDRTR